jgi:hypothetical protein
MESVLGTASRAGIEMLAEGAIASQALRRDGSSHDFGSGSANRSHRAVPHMVTPGGHRMSVAMTNCGRVGWTASRGYRYDSLDRDRRTLAADASLLLVERAAVRAGCPASIPTHSHQPLRTGAKLTLHEVEPNVSQGVRVRIQLAFLNADARLSDVVPALLANRCLNRAEWGGTRIPLHRQKKFTISQPFYKSYETRNKSR